MDNKEDLINFLNVVQKGIDEAEHERIKIEKANLINKACNCGFIESNLSITSIGLNYLHNNLITY